MIIDNVRKRMNSVLMVDSINSTEADFLATHVPFRTIRVKNIAKEDGMGKQMSEEELFSKFFESSEKADQHQLIVVEGSSGSGKSHFIRWLHARMRSMEDDNNVVLLIRRSDNTLKGTIKQLLDIPEVRSIRNKDIYERLVKANQTISEQKFKDSIYHNFAIEIKNDDECETLSSLQRKNLIALLSNSLFEERMLRAGGPIDRIYHKIVSTTGETNLDTDALFTRDDFTLDTLFGEELSNVGADRHAVKMANALIPDEADESMAETVKDYMNSLVDHVIQACAGIEPGDFQQIFKDIRQELHRQGKDLVLLIEDITSFTGINQDLLNALVTLHTGAYQSEQMCRLWSVIGTTTQYYKLFRDNYRDRITTQITIEDGTLGTVPEDLYLFVAKYLNAISLPADDLETWYRNGAVDSEYPVHVSSSSWHSYFSYQGKQFDLYPFNQAAIKNLYDNMGVHQTPRYIIREIIEPALNDLINNKKHFLRFLSAFKPIVSDQISTRIRSVIHSLGLPEDEKADVLGRFTSLISFWGNGTLSTDADSVSGIDRRVFTDFSLGKVADSFKEDDSTGSSVEIPPAIEPGPIAPSPVVDPPEYTSAISNIDDWFFNKKPLMQAAKLRDTVADFILDTLNWQQFNIPMILVKRVRESSNSLIAIERQDRAQNKGLYLLEATEETFALLKCFARWIYLGKSSWVYATASDDLFYVTSWLEQHRRRIIDALERQNSENVPDHVKCAVLTDLYYKMMCGSIPNDTSIITPAMILQDIAAKLPTSGHSTMWTQNLKYVNDQSRAEKNHRYILDYFNMTQGTSGERFYIQFSKLEDVLKDLAATGYDIDTDACSNPDITVNKDVISLYSRIRKNLGDIIASELSDAKSLVTQILGFWDFDEEMQIEASDIRDLMNDILTFYQTASICGVNVADRSNAVNSIISQSEDLERVLATIRQDYSQETQFCIFRAFSQDPLKAIKMWIAVATEVASDIKKVTKQQQVELNDLKMTNLVSGNHDNRFDQLLPSLNELKKGVDV